MSILEQKQKKLLKPQYYLNNFSSSELISINFNCEIYLFLKTNLSSNASNNILSSEVTLPAKISLDNSLSTSL